MGKKLLLLDVDCGVDDAQAMMMALAAPNVQILAITCVHGNTKIENVCKNVLRVLEVCQKTKIPVFRGSGASLLGNQLTAANYHGEDGLGDAPDPKAPGLEHLQAEYAVNALIRIATEHAGQVSLVATGPLTNVALAFKMDPTFSSKLKQLYIMGGNTESRGNVAVCSEFNFAVDPEAAYIVLNNFACPTYIATWEYCLRYPLPWKFFTEWVNQCTGKACFMKKISAHTEKFIKGKEGSKEMYFGPGFVSCDCFAMSAAIDESVVTEYIQHGVSVELQGSLTRGMMVMDTLGLLKNQNKAFIMTKCDIEKFKQLMMSALK
ncbi:inosine-uridine preferring nucleoside hydrolase-like [Scyliorhinus canicula]|uniref:inosine-uridine preferring nucleoside hydrolase-like n=1 Tax=Scyliorhinus canicula TaxID=7830 RepID=UPI0018F790A8|nr:inosine-uridine preferring nucleoside hydrolase-like [Scyliorhinus canicula]XP_038674866.1 inosine-uridine preferring nucleoside hydrolase-like [Scyliorhinus canicula]